MKKPEIVYVTYIKMLQGGRRSWPVILSGLKSLLETGQPLPQFDMSFLQEVSKR